MELKRGLVVRVKAGHDAGRFCVITEIEGSFCFLADGKYRKLDSPKKKNPLHIAPTVHTLELDQMTDRQLRRNLSRYYGGEGEDFTHEGGK